MKTLFSPPALQDLVAALQAWRYWLVMLVIGLGIGGAYYNLSPPAYRAQATVNLDFNLEQAWPGEPDRMLFMYLEREVRKLEEIAWSDDVLQEVSALTGTGIETLRTETLHLSQPGEAGWHFYAVNKDPVLAANIASVWVTKFEAIIEAETGNSRELDNFYARTKTGETLAAEELERFNFLSQNAAGISPFIQIEITQQDDLPIQSVLSLGSVLLVSTFSMVALGFLAALFFAPLKS